MTTNGTFSTSRITEVSIKKPSGLRWCCQVVWAAAPRCCRAPQSCHLQPAPGGCRGQAPLLISQSLFLSQISPCCLCLPALTHSQLCSWATQLDHLQKIATCPDPSAKGFFWDHEGTRKAHRVTKKQLNKRSRSSYQETPHFRSLQNQTKKIEQIIS